MYSLKKLKKEAFTLIELIIVIAIIAILASIAIPKFKDIQENAKNKTIEYNASMARKQILLFIDNYSEDKMFEPSQDTSNYSTDDPEFYLNESSLSRCLERYWENGNYGENSDYYRNPYSDKFGVVNYTTHSIGEANAQQAIFISSTSTYSYDTFSLNQEEAKKWLRGCIMIYMANDGSDIDIYYIDGDGLKSDFHLIVKH